MFDDEYDLEQRDIEQDIVDGKDEVDVKIVKKKIENDEEANNLNTNCDENEIKSQKLRALLLVKKYIILSVEHVIVFFNNYSKDFRQVSKQLTKDKIILRKAEFNNSSIQPNTSVNLTIISNTNPNISNNDADLDEVDAEYDLDGKHIVYRLFNSIYYLILSQSELVCYFLMILTHLLSASILSLPLPFAVFLWALLSLPRPNKIFWITCITYIEVKFENAKISSSCL